MFVIFIIIAELFSFLLTRCWHLETNNF